MKEYIVRIEHGADGAVHYFRTDDEIVRCKDCKYMDENNLTCSVWESGTYYDGYCSYGERRTE